MTTTAIYPGSFDPVTLGHEDLIQRSLHLVDHVIVAVAVNAGKDPLFTLDERVALLEAVMDGGPRVEIVADPRLKRNVHEILAESEGGRITITCENVPSAANPKTSWLAILSALAVVQRLVKPVSIGN